MTKEELRQKIAACPSRMSDAMRLALEDILLTGTTWQSAMMRRRVTSGGILRAMRRIGVK